MTTSQPSHLDRRRAESFGPVADASVLAVEPDPLMAEKARAKGIAVEEGTFEEWDARGRTFDLVVFARSFHWVDPQVALARIPSLLNSDGRLALL